MKSADAIEGATLIGAMLAYPMYGTLVCQVALYFKRFPDDLRHLKVLVALILLTSSVGIVINVNLIWYYCIQRGIGVDPHIFQFCDHWTISAFFIPNEMTCFLAEALFLKRMWTLSKKRYPTVLAFVPFMLGWVFTIVYVQGMFRHWCYPEMLRNEPYLFTCYGLRFLSDGTIAGTMCTLLYQQMSDMPTGCRSNRPNFVRIVNSLVAWTISTGLVMWVSAIAWVLSYILLPKTYVALAIYLIRGNIYANAVLALLHVRTRYRKVADEVVSLHVQVQVDTVSGNGGGLTLRSRT
ncbi:hypothetical protein K443DRAFT_684285 [Laccaria amethystina LaAM-08-1]|uniref:Unplaced genomic scaffold K443scaffold_295, whole genome shotgun sequence n=1 Tax=Laccaria amethystina LaAM-08-1 TaxID=1095629 RepID=A0A0C9X7U7_9AGAR|nr:hypothetical protein K443DRAFT_684285 [Laccaria amethystina LaAM-08-1]